MVVLERVTDFFLGLNAGQWLKIRVAQISDGATAALQQQLESRADAVGALCAGVVASEVLEGTGLQAAATVERPPQDAQHLHHFFGNFGAQFASEQQEQTDARTRQLQKPRARSKTDAERMSEALALVRARRATGCGGDLLGATTVA